MPGPRNFKKKRSSHSKKERTKHCKPPSFSETYDIDPTQCLGGIGSRHSKAVELLSPPSCPPATSHLATTTQCVTEPLSPASSPSPSHDTTPYIYIHDPGNGPRVRDTRAFLSSFFAQPPSLDEPLCAEFAQEEVLQMLMTVLPDETALILWYNKSRAKGRICPACQRLYHVGDRLPEHFTNADTDEEEKPWRRKQSSPQLVREQQLSGLCSPMCFILASFSSPGAIKSTWGRTADEISDETWNLLDENLLATHGRDDDSLRARHYRQRHGDLGLSALLKMTRLPDLGLGQLCLPEVDFEKERD